MLMFLKVNKTEPCCLGALGLLSQCHFGLRSGGHLFLLAAFVQLSPADRPG